MNSNSRQRLGRQWRSVLVLLALLGLGAASGAAFGLYTAGQATARSAVLVKPLDGNPYSPDGSGDDLVNLETEAQLVASDSVAQAVADDTDAGDAGALLRGLDVTVPPNTQILTIEYTSTSRDRATAVAQSFADVYLASRADRAEAVVSARAGRVQEQIDTLTETLDELITSQAQERSDVRKAILQQQIDGTTSQIGQLQTALADLQTGELDPGQVITPAYAVGRSTESTITLYTLAGGIAGVGLAIFLLAVFRRRPSLPTQVDPFREPWEGAVTPGHARSPVPVGRASERP